MAKKKWTFEQAMEKLEQIVEQLETQEVSLEESVQLYKEGMALADICKQKITIGSIVIAKKCFWRSRKNPI